MGKLGPAYCLLAAGALAALAVSCNRPPPASSPDPRQWSRETLLASYNSIGQKNGKWDGDALEALNEFADLQFARGDETELSAALAGESAQSAVAEGCDDPMIQYLYVRFAPAARTNTFADRQNLYRAAAKSLQASDYPPLRKFYANVDAAEILWAHREKALWPEVRSIRWMAMTNLAEALGDKTLPDVEAAHAAETLFQLLQYDAVEFTNAFNQVQTAMSGGEPHGARAEIIRAEFYLIDAWRARGNGTAGQVTAEGWRLFRERLKVAEKALDRAWSIDPGDEEIPTLMISVIEGEQGGRPEMEKWFARAMALDADNYEACRSKLHFLLPQWYGSREEMLAFGRECVASPRWKGEVPLILVDAHKEFDADLNREDRAAYWTQPDVWPDIQAAYEKYSRVNPNAAGFRYPYAWYAFRCGQFPAFCKQIALIRTNDGKINYNYFGGEKTFAELMARATADVPGQH
ncbi:MAG TPA: hypothetical protein VFV81_08365 [Verrucomicrobiae bacterium]|nr:hypothetical protein [Verrucomicrobiae bacterium]